MNWILQALKKIKNNDNVNQCHNPKLTALSIEVIKTCIDCTFE